MSATNPSVDLKTGDRMSRAEFHRRYCQTPEKFKAELIEGVVYVASPARARQHGIPHSQMNHWTSHYSLLAPGVTVADNSTVILDDENEVQPDLCLFREPPSDPEAGRVGADGYIHGAPQLVVEIAASSASIDLGTKLRAYQKARVPEYLVWQVIEREFYWFDLQNGQYVRILPDDSGIIESKQFPGLRLHIAKLLAGAMAGVIAEIQPPAGR